MAKLDLTPERLHQVLHYEPTTGIFTWRISRPGPRRDKAGTKGSGNYIVISIDGIDYRAHHLVWLYIHGTWPANEIDHINGVRHDNRFENLRDVTRYVNTQNLHRARKDNKFNILGVCKYKKKFRADIYVNGASLYLGLFSTPEEAHAAYLDAKRKLHTGCTI